MRFAFAVFRYLLVALTGHGYDRATWMNTLHHKLSYRLHKLLPKFGITGVQKIAVPNLSGKFMYVIAEDGGVAHQLIMYRNYEPYESRLVRERVKPGMVVYNIGANLGYYALLASERIGKNGTVYAFEPEPKNFEMLSRTIKENHAANVTAIPAAVGAMEGVAALSISPTNSGDHQLQAVAGRDHVAVEVLTVDDFIAQVHPAPNIIILDVQGAELDVLRGAQSLLARPEPLALFAEFWPRGLNERRTNGAADLLDLLTRARFSFQLIDEKRQMLVSTTASDLLRTVTENNEVNLLCVRI
ncbi:MAG TPA: FkbM family methyltransferase [Candidatus Kapabacteria bacterium]|jgi:FkbM family methyltransferase|nr:FkbM family methyltransferase [Candidatus Kapabacteria bacterium]